jgi:hypothetical protein
MELGAQSMKGWFESHPGRGSSRLAAWLALQSEGEGTSKMEGRGTHSIQGLLPAEQHSALSCSASSSTAVDLPPPLPALHNLPCSCTP